MSTLPVGVNQAGLQLGRVDVQPMSSSLSVPCGMHYSLSFVCFWDNLFPSFSRFVFKTEPLVAQGLELTLQLRMTLNMTLLPLFPEGWAHACTLPCLIFAVLGIFSNSPPAE